MSDPKEDSKVNHYEREALATLKTIFDRVQAETKGVEAPVFIGKQLRQKNPIWECECRIDWPIGISFTSEHTSLREAKRKAAVKCLNWLRRNGKIDGTYPVLYNYQEIADEMRRPLRIDVPTNLMEEVRQLVDEYNKDIESILRRDQGEKLEKEISKLEEEYLSSFVEEVIPKGRKNTVPKEMQEDRSLPIYPHREKIVSAIKENRVVLIRADTGSGKTSQIPQYILNEATKAEGWQSGRNCRILVSQPRVTAALSLANFVAAQRGETVGESVGFATRHRKVAARNTDTVTFCSEGVVFRTLLSPMTRTGISHVIIDEIHNRSLNLDFLMLAVREIIRTESEPKVILMSATASVSSIEQFFPGIRVIEIPGKVYPVSPWFLENITPLIGASAQHGLSDVSSGSLCQGAVGLDHDYVARLIGWIRENKPPGAILCFLPSWERILKVKCAVEGLGGKYFIVPFHSKLPLEKQELAFRLDYEQGVCKVILATDIAESSITIPDVRYVIDSGMRTSVRWDPIAAAYVTQPELISQSNLLQRRGRAGRVAPGEAYHLMTLDTFKRLAEHPKCGMFDLPLEQSVLMMRRFFERKVSDMIRGLPEERKVLSAVRKSMLRLKTNGCLDDRDELTARGRRIVHIAVNRYIESILLSSVFGCSDSIISLSTVQSSWSSIAKNLNERLSEARGKLIKFHQSSDHLAMYAMLKRELEERERKPENKTGERLTNVVGEWETEEEKERETPGMEEDRAQFYDNLQREISVIRDNLKRLKYAVGESKGDAFEWKGVIERKNAKDENENGKEDEPFCEQLILGILLHETGILIKRRNYSLETQSIWKKEVSYVDQVGRLVVVRPSSVNYGVADPNVSPLMMSLIEQQYGSNRRMVAVSSTSVISPLTAYLFTPREYRARERYQIRPEGGLTGRPMIDVSGGYENVILSGEEQTIDQLRTMREIMWKVVDYLIVRTGLSEYENCLDFQRIGKFNDGLSKVLRELLDESGKSCVGK